jgi:UDP-N-acetylglucosamine 2-epimerase (non-hydrolysing)
MGMTKHFDRRRVRVMTAIGTRPEAIKMAPIIREFQTRKDECDLTILNTAQHRELVDEVLSIYNITPDIDLDMMEENQSLTTLFSKGAKALENVFCTQRPDVLLIEGDTSTVFVASLMAFYSRIDVAHVEAGLRSYDIYNPFPEEVYRRITSVISKIHFAPTDWAKRNLLREGHPEGSIFVTGNPVIDTLLSALEIEHRFRDEVLNEIDYSLYKVVLVTAHRRENHGGPLVNICNAIAELAKLHQGLVFVYPVHPNPNVETTVREVLGQKDRILLLNPLDYLSFVNLMKKCHLILTDSGGIQEEAPTLRKPVLVLREKTERPEAIDAGTAKVIGTDQQRIISEVTSLLYDQDKYDGMVVSENPFGDGKAARRIADVVVARYSSVHGEHRDKAGFRNEGFIFQRK